MVCSFHLFLLIVPYLIVQTSSQEEGCSPSFVRGIEVTDNLTLTWNPAPDEPCTISYYLVKILSREVETEYEIEDTVMDVSFLPTCEDARFTVIPISSDDVEGSTVTLQLQMPVPLGANLTIEYMRVSQVDVGIVTLAWELEEEWKACTRRFRVVIHNEDYNNPVDVYVEETSVTLEHILPCEVYTFGVRAMHSLTLEGPISLLPYHTPSARMAAPALQSLTLATTSIDIKWQLESYWHNRCAVSSITIDASPSFSAAYPIHDDPSRPILSTNMTGLQADTMYFLNVTVINTAGPSVPYLVAIQTLPDA